MTCRSPPHPSSVPHARGDEPQPERAAPTGRGCSPRSNHTTPPPPPPPRFPVWFFSRKRLFRKPLYCDYQNDIDNHSKKPVRAEPCTDVLNTVVAGVKCGIASRARSYHREVIPLKVMNQPAACLDSLVSVSALRQRLQKLSQIY